MVKYGYMYEEKPGIDTWRERLFRMVLGLFLYCLFTELFDIQV